MVSCKNNHNRKFPSEPYCSCDITCDITINLLDEEAREPEGSANDVG